jgi:hypothetical protein
MAVGKLYKSGSGEELIGNVNYRFHDESETSWWGELVLTEYKRVGDGAGYIIELEDGRRGNCSLRKRVNRAVSGIPPLYRYHFKGRGRLE